MKRTTLTVLVLVLGLALSPRTTHGSSVGHYSALPGVTNIRDGVMPEPGFYGSLYNFFYTTDRLNDANGNQINSVTITSRRGQSRTLNLGVDIDMYMVAPALAWVSPWKILGAKYGALILLPFLNTDISASLDTVNGRGISPSTGEFDVSDVYVQPLWLGWAFTHWDFSFAEGFWAPTGKYNTQTGTLPARLGGGTVKFASPTNTGFGFWTNQLKGTAAWYPWAHKGTAVTASLVHEIHGEKEDFNSTHGQDLTLNWGISQFLPLMKDKSLLLEVGPAGYSSWQITDDSGSDAKNPSVHSQVHAAGGQLGLTYVPWMVSLNGHAFYEFAAEARFQGQAYGISVAKKF